MSTTTYCLAYLRNLRLEILVRPCCSQIFKLLIFLVHQSSSRIGNRGRPLRCKWSISRTVTITVLRRPKVFIQRLYTNMWCSFRSYGIFRSCFTLPLLCPHGCIFRPQSIFARYGADRLTSGEVFGVQTIALVIIEFTLNLFHPYTCGFNLLNNPSNKIKV